MFGVLVLASIVLLPYLGYFLNKRLDFVISRKKMNAEFDSLTSARKEMERTAKNMERIDLSLFEHNIHREINF